MATGVLRLVGEAAPAFIFSTLMERGIHVIEMFLATNRQPS